MRLLERLHRDRHAARGDRGDALGAPGSAAPGAPDPRDEDRDTPAGPVALAVLDGLPRRLDGRMWGMRPDSISQAFERVCKAAGIKGLTFHDLRHEATSRLFEKGLGLMEVASITGHKTMQMLTVKE